MKEPIPPTAPRVPIHSPGRRAVVHFADFLRHVRRRWYLYLPVFAIWGFAYVRLFIDATPRLPVLFNWTPSLPYRVALLVEDAGDHVRDERAPFFGAAHRHQVILQ